MEDEAMARELERLQGLQDDLYLDDVGGENPERRIHLKKHMGRMTSRSGKFIPLRGRGRARSRLKWGGPGRGRGLRYNKSIMGSKEEEDDFLHLGPDDLDPSELDVLDSWDLAQEDSEEVSEDFLMEEANLRLTSFRRSRGASRGGFIKRGMIGRGSKMPSIQRKIKGPKQMLHGDEMEDMHDMFDIESKPRHQQGRSSYDSSWPRSGYPHSTRDERNRRSDDLREFEDVREDRNSQGDNYIPLRKDSRREGRPASDSPSSRSDSRMKQSDIPASELSDGIYGPARKDPRLVPQQALRREESHLSYDAARKNVRLGPGKPSTKASGNGEQNRDQGRRSEHRARSQSPGLRDQKEDRSPGRGRPHERVLHRRSDRSPSPAWHSGTQRWSHGSLERRHDHSPSPREHRERSLSPRHGRGRLQRDWGTFPHRESSHGFSPRSGRREYSSSPRARRSHTPQPPQPPLHSPPQDESWISSSHPSRMQTQPQYPAIQTSQQQSSFNVMPPPHQQSMYTEATVQGNYQTSAPQSSTYTAQPPATTTETSAYSCQQYNYDSYYQQPYSRDYTTTSQPPPGWTEQRMVYPDMSQGAPVQMTSSTGTQPPPASTAAQSHPSVDQKSEEAKKEAIKNEMIQQKQTLSKQREEYVCKAKIISRELQLLKEQEEDLLQEKSKDNERILKENHKLQLEIQNKLKAINNVIDMLTGIIGDHKDVDSKSSSKSEKKRPKTPPDTPPRSSSSSPERRSTHEKDAEKISHDDDYGSKDNGVYNYIYYDPELHWCRVCNVFPRTAKEYLNHLHSANHKRETLERKLVDFPWHKIQADQEVPHIKGARSKRTPIRGLQFFISATAWYCKLCDVWIGDLHCASLHLKSKRHADNYNQYTEKNPHWEADWLADREKAYENTDYMKVEDQELLPPGVEQPESKPQPMPGYKNDTFFEMQPGMKGERTNQKSKKKRKKEGKKKGKKYGSEMRAKKRRTDFKLSQESSSSSGSSSTSSSDSSNSDSEDNNELDNGDKSKSIRVTMRNKAKILQPVAAGFVKAPRSKWDSPEASEEEDDNTRDRETKEKEQKRKQSERMKKQQQKLEREEKRTKGFGQKGGNTVDDKMLREWMTTSKDVSDGEKQLLNSLKDRLKQKQEADKEGKRDGRSYYDSKGYYDDRRDRKGSKKRSESPGSPYRTKRRGNDRYEKHDSFYNTPERSGRKNSPKKDSLTKTESKIKDDSRKSPDRKSEIEKKTLVKLDYDAEDDSAEAKFEKQTAESAKLTKKGKKPPVMSIPKSKLPFIGRMPILKHFAKKKVPGKGDSKPEEEEKKEAAEDPAVLAQYQLEFTNVGGKVHIGPTATTRKSRFDQMPEGTNTPAIGPKLPPNLVKPTTLGEINLDEVASNTQEQQAGSTKQEGVQDMDIDEDSSSDHGAPVIESETPVETAVVDSEVVNEEQVSTKKQSGEAPLPKDFQEALDILFPGPDGPEKKEEVTTNISQSAVIESGPKPPSNMGMMQMGHPNQWGDPQLGHPQMMAPHQMAGYGSQQMGPPIMGPMHGMHGPPNMQRPPHMQSSHPRMYGPGMQGPPQWATRGPPGPRPPRPPGPPVPPGVPCMHNVIQRSHNEPRPPPLMSKDQQKASSPTPPKGILKKSTTGRQMSAEDLAMLGIDAEDMAAQSF